MVATHTAVLHTSGAGRWMASIDRLPPIAWLGLQAAALWPHWRWAGRRMVDGSDDPLGLASIAVLAFAVWRLAPRLRSAPSRAWLVSAMVGTVAAALSTIVAPPLVAALLAVLALAAGLCAFAPGGTPLMPLGGLAVLSLPVVSSLQFYAGFPLRVVTAQFSTWMLQVFGVAAERSGSAMWVNGQLVIVDAPCSGVQMVWMAYFCACAIACFRGLPDRVFARRAAWVGVIVMLGNVLRNSVLVLMESQGSALPNSLHEGIGLVALALVCVAVVRVVSGGSHANR
jgi:exosortase/archaeosortase family protein